MNNEEKELLNKLGEKINKLIDKELEKYGYDRAGLNFLLKCDILDDNFKKIDEITLIEDDKNYCVFCRRKTYYYSEELNDYVCPCCLMKLKKANFEVSATLRYPPTIDGTTGEYYER